MGAAREAAQFRLSKPDLSAVPKQSALSVISDDARANSVIARQSARVRDNQWWVDRMHDERPVPGVGAELGRVRRCATAARKG